MRLLKVGLPTMLLVPLMMGCLATQEDVAETEEVTAGLSYKRCNCDEHGYARREDPFASTTVSRYWTERGTVASAGSCSWRCWAGAACASQSACREVEGDWGTQGWNWYWDGQYGWGSSGPMSCDELYSGFWCL